MQSFINWLFRWYFKLSIVPFVIANVILIIGINLFITSLPFAQKLTNSVVQGFKYEGPVFVFLVVILIGPLFETILFQTLIIRIVLYLTFQLSRIKYYLAIFFSASVFAVEHHYNLTYVIAGFFTGVILASSYLVMLKRGKYAILITFSIHSLVNLIPFIQQFVIK